MCQALDRFLHSECCWQHSGCTNIVLNSKDRRTLTLSRILTLGLLVLCFAATGARATVYVDDFSGDLSAWTASPAHLDNYQIVDEQLFLDGYGHLTGLGGWGVMQYNQSLGSHFIAEWDARLVYYDYINFTLHADAPWDFQANGGSAQNGYLGWIDVNDPVLPKMDLRMAVNGETVWLDPPQQDIPLPTDIALGQWVHFELVFNHGQIQVMVDGVQRIDGLQALFADADYRIGLSFGEDSQGYIDNFRVTTIDPLESVVLNISYDQAQATTRLEWTPVLGAVGYQLYRAGTPAPTTGLVLLGDTLAWSPGTLSPDSIRRYRVRALAP